MLSEALLLVFVRSWNRGKFPNTEKKTSLVLVIEQGI